MLSTGHGFTLADLRTDTTTPILLVPNKHLLSENVKYNLVSAKVDMANTGEHLHERYDRKQGTEFTFGPRVWHIDDVS